MNAHAVALPTPARAARRAVPRRLLAALPLVAAAIALAWILRAELLRLYGLTGSAWDLAYDQQVVWNVSAGQGFYSSFARANFLGIHFELILVVLAAVEKLWPNPSVLLIFSAAGLAGTAPAAYLFLRAILPADRPESPWLSMALAVTIPFWAATQEAARDFFHPENMALALALLAAWAGIRGHRVAMWILAVLVLMCKEDQVYTVAVVGLLVRVYGAPVTRKHWRFIVYLAGAWFLIGTGILQQHFRNYGYTDFVYYRWLIGLQPGVHPSVGTVLGAILEPQALLVVAVMLASMFALPLLAPRWLLLAVPPYLANVLSGHTPQNILQVHYVLLLMFPLIVAGGIGARRLLSLRSFRPAAVLVVIIPALLLGFVTGRLPPSLATGEGSLYTWPDSTSQLVAAEAVIPADAPVSADNGLDVWLANRHIINDFPDMLTGSCYVVIDRRAYLQFINPTDVNNPQRRKAAIEQLSTSGRHLLYDDGRFQVWSPVKG